MSARRRRVQARHANGIGERRRPAQPSQDKAMSTPKLTASYITLAGAGFSEPPRFTFRQRCEAASAAGFARIGIQLNDLTTLTAADVADILSENDIESRRRRDSGPPPSK